MIDVPPFFPGPVAGIRDFGCDADSRALAAEIDSRWHACGHRAVRTWIEERYHGVRQPDGTTRTVTRYLVRSNLVNGLPPDAMRRGAAA